MTDFGARLIANSIRFLAFCIFSGLTFQSANNRQKVVDRIVQDYEIGA